MSIAVIINPVAGGSRADVGLARAALASAVADRDGIAAEVFLTDRRGHARALAQAAVRRGVTRVIAWGGDGTVSEVASALAFSKVALGIVPAGSGNGLAREFGIERRPAEAIARAIRAEPHAIDMGELDGRLFVNLAGIGFDAYVASAFDVDSNRRRGFVRYAGITARALRTYRSAHYSITTAAGRRDVQAILVTIANSAQFGNGARIAPGARVDDGLLDLVVVAEETRWRTVWQLPRLFTGTVDRVPGCSIGRITWATIESERPILFHVDGEPVQGRTSVHAHVHPRALWVAVGLG